MDNELFELCKEVHEHLAWDGHLADWGDSKLDSYGQLVPKYNSDYLLEKLPSGVCVQKDSAMMGEKQFYVAAMVYFKGTPKEYRLNCGDKTSPLKALLKLVLALNDAGIKL